MRTFLSLAAAAAALLVATPADAKSPIEGLWANPKHSIVVRIGPCGPQWCGKVVKATAKAEAKAAKQGYDGLEGEKLLSNIVPAGNGRWKGRVYVPRFGTHVGSSIVLVGPDKLNVSGCVAGIICKKQQWTRVD